MLKKLSNANKKYCFVALTALAGCSSDAVCGANCPGLQVSLTQNSLDKASGGVLQGSVGNYTRNPPQKVQLVNAQNISLDLDPPMIVPDGTPKCGSAGAACANSAAFSITVNQDLAKFLDGSALSLVYQDDDGSGPSGMLREIRSPVVLAAPLSATASVTLAGATPAVERLGFSNGKLMSLRSYTETMAVNKAFIQYTTNATELKEGGTPPGIAAKVLRTANATADIVQSRVVYLDDLSGGHLGLVNCPTAAASTNDCANPLSPDYPGSLLPSTLKGFVVAPGGETAVLAQEDGLLRLAALPYQTAPTPALAWTALSQQPTVMRKDKILLALGDLNKDGAADLVAVHQDGKNQDVTVYMGKLGAIPPVLSYNAQMSADWQKALGSTTLIGALAVGDLNGDDRADIAISRGLHLEAWLTRASLSPVRGWTADVPVADTTVGAKAMTIGKLDGEKGKKILVVASSSPPDAMGNVAQQFLHSFIAP